MSPPLSSHCSPGPPPSSGPAAPSKARSHSWCPSPHCQGSGDAQTHPVCRAEPLRDHCGAERAGWVHGAAGEVDLDTEREAVRRTKCLSAPTEPQLSQAHPAVQGLGQISNSRSPVPRVVTSPSQVPVHIPPFSVLSLGLVSCPHFNSHLFPSPLRPEKVWGAPVWDRVQQPHPRPNCRAHWSREVLL